MDRLMRHGRNLALAGAAAALALGTTACSSGDGGAAFRANVALSQPDQVMDALPSPAALPSGWRLAPGAKPPKVIEQAEASSDCRKKLSISCSGIQLGGTVRYEMASNTDNDIRFTLLTFDTTEHAGPVFEAMVTSLEKDDSKARRITLKAAAEQSQGFERPAESSDAPSGTVASVMAMRVGTVVALIELDEDERDHKTLQQFTALEVERIKKVQQGTNPNA
ncbi:hypothetical protein RMN57_02865 [Kitasatospora sp. CM 4170]|uniref:Lipoprotein n=1 Tax=Kitasatospora aburaviensis TaxID=67265 RepID=A0ABW1EUP5_9ACTN|nr:hypothetical protein [Kitasatospora sp. CM 4170]WNM43718.1 hypothetical protein RMN57_02865 [Kitasatospora sp. CM 4170]